MLCGYAAFKAKGGEDGFLFTTDVEEMVAAIYVAGALEEKLATKMLEGFVKKHPKFAETVEAELQRYEGM